MWHFPTRYFRTARAALHDLSDGISLMSGGFGLCGIPENSIVEIARQGIKNIRAISNNIGNSGRGLAILLKNRQINRAVCSYVGGNPDLEEQMLAGEVDVELVPQGTFFGTDSRRRNGHPRFLYSDRLWHAGRRGQGGQGVRSALHHGNRFARRLCDYQGPGAVILTEISGFRKRREIFRR